jgi:chaperonin GroEL (HSP60 family)
MSRLNFVLMGKLLYLIKIKQKNFMYKDLLILCSTIGVKLGEACTIVLRGATKQILDEADRSIHDALCVLTQTVKETKIVFGGGNI